MAASDGDTLVVHAVRYFGWGQRYTLFTVAWPETALVPGPSTLRVEGRDSLADAEGNPIFGYDPVLRLDSAAADKQYLVSGVDILYYPDKLVPGRIYKLEFETGLSGAPIQVTRYLRVLPAENRICRARIMADSVPMRTYGGQKTMARRFRIDTASEMDRSLYDLFPRRVADSAEAGLIFTTAGFDSAQDEYPYSAINLDHSATHGEGILVQTRVRDTVTFWTFAGERACGSPAVEAPFSRDSALRVLQRTYPPGSEGNPFPDPLRLRPFFGSVSISEDPSVTACYEDGAWRVQQIWMLPKPWEEIWNIGILEYKVDAAGAATFSFRKDTSFPVPLVRSTGIAKPGSGPGRRIDALGRKTLHTPPTRIFHR